MAGITSKEWSDFLASIKDARTELGNPEFLWYRGHPNSKYYLLASLLRYKNGLDKERQLFTDFKKFTDRILKRRESDWETLFQMQHYGVPTRLLDWSETFGIALFFAAHYNQINQLDEDAAIYLLNPIALNKISGISQIYRVLESDADFSYSKIYWEQKPFAARAPIAIEPIFINDRMLAQRGVFTVHHDSINPIEVDFPGAIKKVILPNNMIPAAIEFLELSNINVYTVFPDIGGIAGYIQDSSGLIPRW